MSKSQQQISFENYRDNVRPALFDVNSQRAAQAALDKQRQNYAEAQAPKTEHGRQAAHDAKVLAGYKEMLRAAERDPMGPNPARVRHYKESIEQLEAKMGLDKMQASFEGSKAYKQALEHAEAVRQVAPDDTESQNLVNLALEALSEHKDVSRFRSDVAIIAIEADTREKQRQADANLASIEANMKQARVDRENAKLALDNHTKIETAKQGGAS